jgi:hypothetical protein
VRSGSGENIEVRMSGRFHAPRSQTARWSDQRSGTDGIVDDALSRIFPFNEASRALCRKHGFGEVGIYEKHARLDGRWLDVVIVERLIPANLERLDQRSD